MPPHSLSSALYCLAFVLIGLNINSLGSLIPVFSKLYDQEEHLYAIVFTFRGIGYLLGNICWGLLQLKYDAHRLMIISSALISLTCLAMIYTSSISLMSFVLFFNSIGCSGIELFSQSQLIARLGKEVDMWMQVLHFSFGFGALISPLIISQVQIKIYHISILVCTVVALALYNIPSHQATHSEGQIRSPSKLLLAAICAWFMVYVGAEVSYGGWIPTYSVIKYDLSSSHAALTSSVYWTTISMGRLSAVFLAKKFTSSSQLKSLLIVSCLVTVVNSLLLDAGGSFWVYGCSALLGFTLSAQYPLMLNTITQLGFHLSTMQISAIVTASSVGESFFPMLTGRLMFEGLSWLGWSQVCWGVALLCLFRVVVQGRVQLKNSQAQLLDK